MPTAQVAEPASEKSRPGAPWVSTAVDSIVAPLLKARVTGRGVLVAPTFTEPKFTVVACAITVAGTASDDATSAPHRAATMERLERGKKTLETANNENLRIVTDP